MPADQSPEEAFDSQGHRTIWAVSRLMLATNTHFPLHTDCVKEDARGPFHGMEARHGPSSMNSNPPGPAPTALWPPANHPTDTDARALITRVLREANWSPSSQRRFVSLLEEVAIHLTITNTWSGYELAIPACRVSHNKHHCVPGHCSVLVVCMRRNAFSFIEHDLHARLCAR